MFDKTLILFSFLFSNALAFPPVKSCGTYEVIGKYFCISGTDCVLAAYPDSNSEMKFHVGKSLPASKALAGAWIKTKLEISSLTEPITANIQTFQIANRDPTQEQIRILKTASCSDLQQ